MPLADPGSVTIDVHAGATFSKRWTPTGTPWNLTGYTARSKFRTEYTSSTSLLDLADGTGITLGGTAGWVQIDLTATQTASLGAAVAHAETVLVFDLELVNGSDVTRFCNGLATVYPESTR